MLYVCLPDEEDFPRKFAHHLVSLKKTSVSNLSCILIFFQKAADDFVSDLLGINVLGLYMNKYMFQFIIIINPLTARVVWAPQMICNQFSPFFPDLHCPLGLAELQACPFPDVVFPPLPLSALSKFCLLYTSDAADD